MKCSKNSSYQLVQIGRAGTLTASEVLIELYEKEFAEIPKLS
jgi:hypothetical protein